MNSPSCGLSNSPQGCCLPPSGGRPVRTLPVPAQKKTRNLSCGSLLVGAGGFAKPRPKNSPQDCFRPAGRVTRGPGCSNLPALPHQSRIQQNKRDTFSSTSLWWELVDSNHRSIKQQIYSLSPLATRESSHIHLCACLNSA